MRSARWPGLGVAGTLAVAAMVGGGTPDALHGAQGQPRRPVVGVAVTSTTAAMDTAVAAAALIRGLLSDSAVEVVGRIREPGRPIRATRFLVSLLASPVTEPVVRLDVRTFDVARSAIVIRDSVWALVPAAPDSLAAMGRRLARQLAAQAP